ncbi:hypothetical protein HQ560_20625, partial [bacterium]|nr:hypothetical protein [bacterium]
MTFEPLSWIVLAPAIGGLACFALGRRAAVLSRLVAMAATLLAVGLACGVAAGELPQRSAGFTWLEVRGFEFTVEFVANPFTSWLTVGATGFGLLV